MAAINLVSASLDPSGNLDVSAETDLAVLLNVQVDFDLNTATPKSSQGAYIGAGPTPGFQLCQTLCPSPSANTEFEAAIDGLDSNNRFVSLRTQRQSLAPPTGTVNTGDKLDLKVTPSKGKVGDVLKLDVEYKDVSGAPDPGITIYFKEIFSLAVGTFSAQTAVTDAQGKCSVTYTIQRRKISWVKQGPILLSASAGSGSPVLPGGGFVPTDFELAYLIP